MPMWLIVAVVAAWIVIPFIGVAVVVAEIRAAERREHGQDAKVIEFPSGHAGTEPRPHVEVSFRDALDAGAREPVGVEPRLPRDRPGPGLRT